MFESFPVSSAREWKQQIEKELKGKSFEDTLVYTDNNGITIHPFYHSLEPVLPSEPLKVRTGRSAASYFLSNDPTDEEVNHFVSSARAHGIEKLAVFTESPDDRFPVDWTDFYLNTHAFDSNTLYRNGKAEKYISTLNIFESGASALTELSMIFHLAKSFDNQEKIVLLTGIGRNFYTEIAKYRAVRILENEFNYNFSIRAVSGVHYLTETDEHNNILRAATAAMSAIIGGCDELIIHPYDVHLRDPAEDAHRWAWNIHHLLREEAYLHAINDPAEGSYFLEYLTLELVQRVKQRLKDLEAGIFTLEKYWDDDRSALEQRLNENKETIINVNKQRSVDLKLEHKNKYIYSPHHVINYWEERLIGNR